MKTEVVISSAGIVSDKGYDPEGAICDFSGSGLASRLAGCGEALCPTDFKKRFIDLTPCSIYGVSAAELAWNRIYKKGPANDPEKWGVYAGTAFGGYTKTVYEACREYIKNGPGRMFPGIFNNKACNVTADVIAIMHKLMGADATFMSGRLASGLAIMQAFDDIADGVLSSAVVVGTEAVDEYIVNGQKILGEENAGQLASGAGALIMQSRDGAFAGEAAPLGTVRAVECARSGGDGGFYCETLSQSLADAMARALSKAEVRPDDIDFILSGEGNSQPEAENYGKAYEAVFGKSCSDKIFRAKSMLGNSLGAFPAMNTVLGLMLFKAQSVSLKDRPAHKAISRILITADDPDGEAWALVLER